ncbi:MAG TPA: class I SAM-dependent methyltransferase [Actinomycetes bacterium]|nr:class I SAM-dependent methyltransferase [Actinomycetes bacterium]
MTTRLPGGDVPIRLAERLHALDYTVEGVQRLVGAVASRALERDETLPASRAIRDDRSPLATVVRVLVAGETVERAELEAALGLTTEQLGDLVASSSNEVRASVDLSPCAIDEESWLIASDWSTRHTGVPSASDHVLGVGGASMMLAQCTVRPTVDRSLDIGTGCGVQALLLASHSRDVVATDVSQRCLEFARFNAELNGRRIALRAGSLFEPVVNDEYDLIVSNPPFVVGSPTRGRHDYRDFGGSGDEVCQRVVTGSERHLSPGGWCQLLANWEIVDADDWSLNPRSWTAETGLDGWVIQREVQDPAEYVETWLRDAGEHRGRRYRALYDEWLTALDARGVTGIGFGLINLRRGDRSMPIRRFQHAPQAWLQPVAPDIERWFAVHALLADDQARVLLERWKVSDDVVIEQHLRGGAQPIVMARRTTGMCWSGPIDAFGVDVLARLDGSQPAAEAVLSVAVEHNIAQEDALRQAVPALLRLAEEGFIRAVA